MSNDFEDILASLNKKADNTDIDTAETEKSISGIAEEIADILPPEKSISHQDNKDEQDGKKDKKREKKKSKEKTNIKDNFKNNFVPKVKKVIKAIFTKQVLFVLIAIAVIIAAVFGGIKIYKYSQVAYLKPYTEKYGIEYPQGILEEFCDAYGKNQNLTGSIVIDDTKTEKFVYARSLSDNPYLATGADVKENQQFTAMFLSKNYADLESTYSNPTNFLKASQKVDFNTLFEQGTYQVIAVYYTNTKAQDDKGYVFPYDVCGNMTEDSFIQYRDRLKTKRLYDTGYTLSKSDKILSLIVDSDYIENFKFVVVCKKTDKFVKSDVAVMNKNIQYPQIWYDLNKKDNPYKLDGKWYPDIFINVNSKETKKSNE